MNTRLLLQTLRKPHISIPLFLLVNIVIFFIFFTRSNESISPQQEFKQRVLHTTPDLPEYESSPRTTKKHHTDHSTLRTLPKIFYSSTQCNTYQHKPPHHPVPDFFPTYTHHAQCSFQNMCMNKRGEWLLFLDEEHNPYDETEKWFEKANTRPWIYTQYRFTTERGDFKVKVFGDGPMRVNGKTLKSIKTEKEFVLSKSFTYVQRPTFMVTRFAAGNVGHLLMDGMLGTSIQMTMFNLEKQTDNNILFLDDMFDNGIHDWIASFNYNKYSSDKYSVDFYSLMTTQPILQKCSARNGRFSIETAPCRNSKPHTPNELDGEEGDEIQTCFKQIIGGIARPYLMSPIGAEVINEPFRSLVSNVKNIDLNPDLSEKEEIIVTLHNKPKHGRHGESIWNIEELFKHISERLPKEDFVKKLNKKVKVVNLKLEDYSAKQQVELFSKTDVYLVDQGSASYMGLFMPRNSFIIQAPDCRYHTGNADGHKKHCYDRFSQYLMTFSHVKVIPFVHLLPQNTEKDREYTMDCNPREVQEKNNCDPILDPQVTYRAIVASLKDRYKDELYNLMA